MIFSQGDIRRRWASSIDLVVGAIIIVGIASPARCDETNLAVEPVIKVAKPLPLFADSFGASLGENLRAKYEATGELRWGKDSVEMPAKSALTRTLNTGCWLETEFDLQFPDPNSSLDCDFQLRLQFDGAGDWYLVWQRRRMEKRDVCELSLRQTIQEDENPDQVKTIRRWPLKSLDSGRWRVVYRQGMVEVAPPQETKPAAHVAQHKMLPLFASFARNADVPLEAIGLMVNEGRARLRSWRVSAAPYRTTVKLSENQLAEMKKAGAMNSELFKLYRAGKPLEAIALAIQVREITQRVLGKEHPSYSQTLNNLGALTQNVGKLKEAGPIYQEAVALRAAIYGKQHPTYGRSLNNLAALKRALGQTAESIRLTEESLAIYVRVMGKENADTATLLNNLGELYRYAGDYALAEPVYLESRGIYERVSGKESVAYARSVANLASLYQEIGDYSTAEPLCIEARDIQLRILGKDHPAYAGSLNNLAALNQARGHYARAEPLYLESTEIIRRALGNKHPGYATSLTTLSGLYRLMGDFARAEAPLLEARKIQQQTIGVDHVRYADTLLGLARLYNLTDETDRAIKLLVEAKDIYERKLGKDHSRFTVAQNSLALMYESRGEYALAEPMLLEARDRLQRQGRTELGDYAGVLHNLANLRDSMGDAEGAEPLLVEAWTLAKRVLGDGHTDTARTANSLARHYEAQGEFVKAEKLHREAMNVLIKAAEDAAPRMSEAQALQWLQHRTPRTDMVLANLRRQGKFDGRDAYQAVWRTKSLVTRLRVNSSLGNGATKEAKQVNTQLRDARLRLARMVSARPKSGQARSFAKQLASASDEKERLEKKLAALNPATRRALSIRDASLQQLIEHLPQGVAVIDFAHQLDWQVVDREVVIRRPGREDEVRKAKKHVSQPVYDAFVVRSDRDPKQSVVWQPLGAAAPIDEALVAWRIQFTGSDDPRGLGSKSVKGEAVEGDTSAPEALLRKRLWAPLEKHLRGCHTVIVLPAAGLHRLPWAALPGRKRNSYLIEDYALGAAAYGQQLYGLLSDSAPSGDSLLVAGGIQYDQRQASAPSKLLSASRRPAATRGDKDRKWAFLPGAATEAQTVVETWSGKGRATQLLGAQASESALASQLPQARYVHLATHGFFAGPEVKNLFEVDLRQQSLFVGQTATGRQSGSAAGRNPLLLCGIVVAGANLKPVNDELGIPTGDDGILTAEELTGLPLRNTELITLSACETGLGDVAAGEGVFGLQRALHQAGARSVVASLWRVDDQATRALMTEFYQGLWKKKLGKLEALRRAQLAVLNRYDLKTGAIRGLGGKSVQGGNTLKSKRVAPRYWAAFQLSGDWR